MRSAPLILLAFVSGWTSVADEPSVSPYLDAVKKSLPENQESSEGYTSHIRQKLEKDGQTGEPSEGYTDKVRESLPTKAGEPSYTEQQKDKLAPKPPGGAIEAVKEGHSELHAKREGPIHSAAGLKVGAGITRSLTASGDVGTGVSFSSIYGAAATYDATFFYEYQPWHSEGFGEFGLLGQAGMAYSHGFGNFAIVLPNAGAPGTNFPSQSHTHLQFFAVPVTLGADFRFNIAKYVRPFASGSGALIGFDELRDDGLGGHTAMSVGFTASAGVNILLDGISDEAAWDLYQEAGVMHYYLTVEYSVLQTLPGQPVSVTANGVFAGLTFEF